VNGNLTALVIGASCLASCLLPVAGILLWGLVRLRCPKSPNHRHLLQNTGVVNRINMHMYLCAHCSRPEWLFESPSYRVDVT
jgi:hypothetical protein